MSLRYTPPWDRFVEEWNALRWEDGFDIKSTVILRDEGTDRVAGVYYLDGMIFVAFYDEEDVLLENHLNTRWLGEKYTPMDWPSACEYSNEDEAMNAAAAWIDHGQLPNFARGQDWFYNFAMGMYFEGKGGHFDQEEEE